MIRVPLLTVNDTCDNFDCSFFSVSTGVSFFTRLSRLGAFTTHSLILLAFYKHHTRDQRFTGFYALLGIQLARPSSGQTHLNFNGFSCMLTVS